MCSHYTVKWHGFESLEKVTDIWFDSKKNESFKLRLYNHVCLKIRIFLMGGTVSSSSSSQAVQKRVFGIDRKIDVLDSLN